MTDNLGPLRQAMSDLAEHGGSSDLYERSLRRSRQTQRRARIAASSAVAVAVLAVGGAVGLLRPDADRPDPSPPVATPTPAPTPTQPSSTAPSSPPATPGTKEPSSTRTQYPDCPSGKTLAKLADLPADWSFPSSTVECWRTWATAAPVGPDTGDGVYLFHYRSGSWRYHSQGSSFQCADLGITSGNPPFCGTDQGTG